MRGHETGIKQDRRVPIVLAALLAAVLAGAPASTAQQVEEEREWLDIRVFAEVPSPGHTEGLVIADDGTVYTGTQQHMLELPDGVPSRVFAYSPAGELLREYVIEGQDPDYGMGIVGMTMDAEGVLYILDRHPKRVIALDTRTGEQWTHATFHQVQRLCIPVSAFNLFSNCSIPDDLAFAPDGTLYVTDVTQGLLWRVPPRGGEAEVWFHDIRLDSVFGPNGIEVMPDGETIMFAQSLTSPFHVLGLLPRPDTSRLYTLPISEDGSPGELDVFWESRPLDGIDGFALAESGNVYVALALANSIAVISPDGQELHRNPANPVENLLMDVPLDDPASIKFLGERMIVTNHTLFLGNPNSFVLFDVWAGEPGAPEFRPRMRRYRDNRFDCPTTLPRPAC